MTSAKRSIVYFYFTVSTSTVLKFVHVFLVKPKEEDKT